MAVEEDICTLLGVSTEVKSDFMRCTDLIAHGIGKAV